MLQAGWPRSADRRPSPGRVAGVAVTVVVLLAGGLSPAAAAASAAAVGAAPSEAQVAALDPADQATLLAPLRSAAAALDAAGRRDAPAAYAGVALDVPAGRTELYLTDPGEAAGLLAAAQRSDPGLRADQVDVLTARYALVTLEAASREAVGTRAPYAVYAAYPAPDASGIRVEVSDPAAAARTTVPQVLAGDQDGRRVSVPVVFVAGTRRVEHDWDAVKWHDQAPFIGGDVLTSDGHRYCTAGLPAVRVRDRHPVMVTAAHCFDSGQRVYTGAGATWAYKNGRTGRYVGTVTKRSTARDAEILDGADNNADESDTSGWKPLTSVAYSYRGDYVCQSGAR